MSDQTEEFLQKFRAAVDLALDEMGQRTVAEIQGTLDTDWPPSSVPGESPHKRTGELQSGVQYIVTSSGSGTDLEVGSGRMGGDPNVPQYLEFDLNRPYMQPALDRWKEGFLEPFAALVRDQLED